VNVKALKFDYVRPPSLTVYRKQGDMEVGYCADHITALVGPSPDGVGHAPHIGFVSSGQWTQFPADEVLRLEIRRDGAARCNSCDRLHNSRVVEVE
jgi:hypothetical protein